MVSLEPLIFFFKDLFLAFMPLLREKAFERGETEGERPRSNIASGWKRTRADRTAQRQTCGRSYVDRSATGHSHYHLFLTHGFLGRESTTDL